ncbi:MAG: arsenite methyltransferase [Anaerolineae bacterium]|nr:arsenite methyltransferase [Anaerolineae bacterium]
MTTSTPLRENDDIRAAVRDRYGQIAAGFTPGSASACCGSPDDAPAIAALYESPDVAALPAEVTGLALGCGDPVALARLEPGQTVLDLGSGGGIDCFLAAQRVGPTGHVIGVDMTPQMLDKARVAAARLGATNVEFRLGEIEHLPVADSRVDVILSNCVINLSPDKPAVFREAFRVLKPGGRLSVSDILADHPLPDALRAQIDAWASCVSGAIPVADYVAALEAAGFVNVQVEHKSFDEAPPPEMAECCGGEEGTLPVFSARVTAHKPA